ncbi:MAG: VWA domain-containing protein [Phycisphaera sp.]|nr:VWA domain-containing protein [Phycisphaera sp.]
MSSTEQRKTGPVVRGGASLFVWCALLSVLVHAGVALGLYHESLGQLDMSRLNRALGPMRIWRSNDDAVVDDLPGAGETGDKPNTLQEISRTLLEATLATPPTIDQTTVTAQPPRAVDTTPPPGADDLLYAPPVALPESVRAQLHAQPELAFDPVGTGGTGTQGASSGDGTGSGADEAQRLLAGSGLTATAIAPPTQTTPIALDRVGPISDSPLVNAPLQPPEVDFSKLALDQTKQLDIPEHLDDDFDYTVTTYVPQAQRTFWGTVVEPEDKRGYFRVDIEPKRSLRRLAAMPKDVVFIIDTSGSVSQAWVDRVLTGVRNGLATLNTGDRFNIMFFKENPVLLSTKGVVEFNEANLTKAGEFLSNATSSGFTDVNAAISRLLVRDVSVQRVYDLVLISDGVPTRGVMDTRDLINLITRDNDLSASIYCLGVGSRQNKQLLEFLAYRNKGFCEFVGKPEDTPNALADLFSKLRYPILKNIDLEVVGLNKDEIYPSHLPDTHQGQRLSIFGRFDQTKSFTMRLHGYNGSKQADFTFTRDLADAVAGDKNIATSWGFWKLHHLYSEMIRTNDGEAIKEQIRELRKRYDLKTVYD